MSKLVPLVVEGSTAPVDMIEIEVADPVLRAAGADRTRASSPKRLWPRERMQYRRAILPVKFRSYGAGLHLSKNQMTSIHALNLTHAIRQLKIHQQTK